jgi:hypothetical protein
MMGNHQLNPTPPILKIPRPRLEITVHCFLRPRALEIAFEILASINCGFQMRYGHWSFLFSSQCVSRGHQVFDLQ